MKEIIDTLNAINTVWDSMSIGYTVVQFLRKARQIFGKENDTILRKETERGYDKYCLWQQHCGKECGVPSKELVLNYWESCLNRDRLPSVEDLVKQNIADCTEATILLQFLMEEWMSSPAFSSWWHDVLNAVNMENVSHDIKRLESNLNALDRFLKEQSICNIAQIIDYSRVMQARNDCTELDVQKYSRVDNNFERMLRVISAGRDIPHVEACESAWKLLKGPAPVIIAGNGGVGKTSMMLRMAVRWACNGNNVIWLKLGQRDGITFASVRTLFSQLLKMLPQTRRVLLCIENPRDSKLSLDIIRQEWPNDSRIQLLVAERCKDLIGLGDETEDYLAGWLDEGKVVLLDGTKGRNRNYKLKSCEIIRFTETYERKRKILNLCASYYVKTNDISEEQKERVIEKLLDNPNNVDVGLVDLLYGMIFEFSGSANNSAGFRMDWHEWAEVIDVITGCKKKDINYYGLLAAHSIVNAPVSLQFFCKYFRLSEREICFGLMNHKHYLCEEPVRYDCETGLFQTKHDMAAELFFKFYRNNITPDKLLKEAVGVMEADEVEIFLQSVVDKSRLKSQRGTAVLETACWSALMEIRDRYNASKILLSPHGRARLCLGLLWAYSPLQAGKRIELISSTLDAIAPELDDSKITRKLYTEWGRWAVKHNDCEFGEQCFLKVIKQNKSEVFARVELGRLLGRTAKRKTEGIKYLEEAVDIAPDDIYARVELGRVLSRWRQYWDDAEIHLRYVIQRDPKNLHARTELAFALSRHNRCVQEAEELLLSIIDDVERDVSARDVLAKLYEKQGYHGKAKRLYREICSIRHNDINAKKGLERLKEYKEEEYR